MPINLIMRIRGALSWLFLALVLLNSGCRHDPPKLTLARLIDMLAKANHQQIVQTCEMQEDPASNSHVHGYVSALSGGHEGVAIFTVYDDMKMSSFRAEMSWLEAMTSSDHAAILDYLKSVSEDFKAADLSAADLPEKTFHTGAISFRVEPGSKDGAHNIIFYGL